MTSLVDGLWDCEYVGESAFLLLSPGQGGTFAVFFANTGTVPWIRDTATQVDLAVCAPDRSVYDIESPFKEWDPGTWLSPSRYATHQQPRVLPGQVGAFVFSIRVPSHAIGTHRFHGELIESASGRPIHPAGYYQDATIAAPSAAAATIASIDPHMGEDAIPTNVQIGGTGFRCVPVMPTVLFGRDLAVVVSCSPTELVVLTPTRVLPADQGRENVAVTVTNAASAASNAIEFTYVRSRHVDVILDTNALRGADDLEFASLDARELRKQHSATELSVAVHIPRIVANERAYQIRSAHARAMSDANQVATLLGREAVKDADIAAAVDEYVSAEIRRNEFRVIELNYSRVDWRGVVDDAIERRPPFSPDKSEKGFRDRLVLEAVRQFAEERAGSPGTAMLFVSADKRLREAIFGGRVGVFAEVAEVIGWINERRAGIGTAEGTQIRERVSRLFIGTDDSLFSRDSLIELLVTHHRDVFGRLPPGSYERVVDDVAADLPVWIDSAMGTQRWRSRVVLTSLAAGVPQAHWPASIQAGRVGYAAGPLDRKVIRDIFDVYWFTRRSSDPGATTIEFAKKWFDERSPPEYVRSETAAERQ